MAAVYNYSKARQSLLPCLSRRKGRRGQNQAKGRPSIVISRSFAWIPLCVEGNSLNISTEEVVQIIREGRETRIPLK